MGRCCGLNCFFCWRLRLILILRLAVIKYTSIGVWLSQIFLPRAFVPTPAIPLETMRAFVFVTHRRQATFVDCVTAFSSQLPMSWTEPDSVGARGGEDAAHPTGVDDWPANMCRWSGETVIVYDCRHSILFADTVHVKLLLNKRWTLTNRVDPLQADTDLKIKKKLSERYFRSL